MSYKVAILSSPRSQSEKDLMVMITHLDKVLTGVEGTTVENITLSPNLPIEFKKYDHVVFCGYDHLTLSYLHACLDATDHSLITFYDEPGKSLESEINDIFFRGVDSGRIPASSLSAIEYSWSYRDILSRALLSCRETESEKPKSRTAQRNSRARQVEDSGKAPSPEGTSPDQDGDS